MPRVRTGVRVTVASLTAAAVALCAAASGAADDPTPGTTTPVTPPTDTTPVAPPGATQPPPATDTPATTPAATAATTPPAATPAPTTTAATTTTVPAAQTTTTAAVAQATLTAAPAPRPGCAVVGAVGVVLPSQGPRVVGLAAEAPPVRELAQAAFAYPADGSVVSADGGSLSASCGSSSSTGGKADVRAVTLFGGWVTVDRVTLGVAGTGAAPTGSFNGLRVAGRALALQPGRRVKLGTWGYLSAADETAMAQPPAGSSPTQVQLSELSIELVEPRGGLPAGTVILLPYAGVELEPVPATPTTTTTGTTPEPAPKATAGPPLPLATTTTTETTKPTKRPSGTGPDASAPAGAEPHERPVGARARAWEGTYEPKPSPFHQPLTVTPPLRAGPYRFPVAGPVDYGDTYGANRSDVASGWHHGDDIFAALGTPVVAVADGTLNRVGWERLGGWRLWVRDRLGDEFYYAHLSGYTPLALGKGKVHVKAGEVIGFVGNTGDAITTSPHLHFEVHPDSLLGLGYDGAVDPTGYLAAWKRSGPVSAPKPVLPRLPSNPAWRTEAKFVYGELLRARGPFPTLAAPGPVRWGGRPEPPFAAPGGYYRPPVAVLARAGRSFPFALTGAGAGLAALLTAAVAGALVLRRRRTAPLPELEPEPEPEG
jgi:murein DD-endopeptidase MepM/ murein hydrolase activator NlpD